jgi:U2 small nuclear ribonucleoprotein A'
VLTKNRITELADLDPLAGFKKLVYLSLMGNPVAGKEVRTIAIECIHGA